MKLLNKTKNQELATQVIEAKSFFARAKGLLGKKTFEPKHTLWIHRCQDIHTCFMKFPIDVVFVNKSLLVTGVYFNIKPWRFVFNFKADSVFEFATGSLTANDVALGDELHVCS